MRQKNFTKKQVKMRLKKVLLKWKTFKLQGKYFPLTTVLGNYRTNSMTRYIKETLFYNLGDANRNGANWYLKYPKKNTKKLAKKVMKATNITK